MKRQPWPDWDTTVPSKTPTLALQGPLPPLPAVLINRPAQALRHWPSILTDPLSLARLHVLISGLEIQPQGADDRWEPSSGLSMKQRVWLQQVAKAEALWPASQPPNQSHMTSDLPLLLRALLH